MIKKSRLDLYLLNKGLPEIPPSLEHPSRMSLSIEVFETINPLIFKVSIVLSYISGRRSHFTSVSLQPIFLAKAKTVCFLSPLKILILNLFSLKF